MTLSASPYAVFKAEEWVSAVAQPIGIGQCLRLTPKKLAPIRSSIKKKSDSTLRKRFSKKHVQLAFAWHVNISNIPATSIQNNSFVSCLLSTYSSMRSFYFTLSSLDAVTRERDWLVSRGGLTLLIAQFVYTIPYYLISIWALWALLTSIVFTLVFDFLLPTWYPFLL